MNDHPPFPRLRPDLQYLRTGPDRFRLIDPRSKAHFELSGRERYLLNLIDRCQTIGEVCQQYERKFHQPLGQREVYEFVEQLRRQCLLTGSRGAPPPATDEIPHRAALLPQLRGHAVNVLFDFLTLLFGWLIHPIWLAVIIPACVLEIVMLGHKWDELLLDLERTFADVPLFPLFLASYLQTVLMLNLPLALVLGICCRKFRGRVRSFGITWGNWVLPTASFFTDVGDSVLGMSDRGRRSMFSVGIVVPLALGALYAICWGACSRAHEGHKFWAFMLVPPAIMVVCQCNPFSVQSSAHWALASALGDWKLHQRATSETIAWIGGWTSPEPLSSRQRWRLRAYGVAHYTVRFAADLALLVAGGYLLIVKWGATGAAILLLLVLFWNRHHLFVLWRWSGTILLDLWETLAPAPPR